MSFDLFDGEGLEFDHLQRLQAYNQRERLAREQQEEANRHAENLASLAKCPHCGSPLAGKYLVCATCTRDIIWVHGRPCRPEERELYEHKWQQRQAVIRENKLYWQQREAAIQDKHECSARAKAAAQTKLAKFVVSTAESAIVWPFNTAYTVIIAYDNFLRNQFFHDAPLVFHFFRWLSIAIVISVLCAILYTQLA